MIAFRKFLNKKSLRAITGEFLATLVFVLFSVGSTVRWEEVEEQQLPAARLLISICFGISFAVMVKCFSDISGAHLNPAVTLAMVLTRKFNIIKAFFYLLAQCLGATAASGILFVVTPESVRGHLGVTWVSSRISVFQGFIMELLITFQMIFVVFATSDPKSKRLKSAAAVDIGISVTIGHLFAVPYTGASMNPARSLGPAIITGNWDDHWVYWLGPILGAVIAAVLHKYFLHPSLKKPAVDGDRVSEKAREDAEGNLQAVDTEESFMEMAMSLNTINIKIPADDQSDLFSTEKKNEAQSSV
ncbi:aquaporin-4-like [Conger conger]|uniref:aquaporin-4-like n=1 Tax=Conger conger TaxID=82655 RepID=UPI002A59D0F0|nr:aquaporin-4-like [Conger conger]